ncbi:probable protein S-acyltransferase 12 [Hibiscus syriacus]|uniref:probable protein S-acyltransferase 12 n=1 Tax=Hibiscus syriacus TaxID=106335 RepID=UPI0019236939|nr:probable protein S-acyltransferase 12 [Hibiscus syriacus]
MEINLFKFFSGLRVLGYCMILLFAAIVGVSYYAVVLLTCGPQLLRGGFHSLLSFTIVIVFHVLLILLLWSYIRVVLKDPGSVPENWRTVSVEENLEVGSSLAAAEDGFERRSRGVGYCTHCQNGKPPRCHHCSICQICVLKMDHRVVNCVGARNYKFFLLFLLYTFLETTLVTLVLLPSFINFFREAKNHSASPSKSAIIFLAFVLNFSFALSLVCFITMHASLLSSNTTSVEVHEKTGLVRWKYDLGRKKNFQQVFGTKKSLWLFPLFSEDDLDNIPALHGLEFPTLSDVEA